ncbi:unnamed protein product [Ranitomeya imitator]|uniref:Suppressor APC domain-containing protein n=1 Tax=Ranitomeya imitator TaxID=111125 RepID=A0ABN9MKN5_9NEOB|nr:unnamed protein product [Ranitomeya imitator]
MEQRLKDLGYRHTIRFTYDHDQRYDLAVIVGPLPSASRIVTAGRKVKAQPLCSAFTLRPAVTVREADGKGPDRHQNFYACNQGKHRVSGYMESAPGTHGLPRAFLHSMRTLYDILDDERRGYVHIQEIESRWRGADTRALPPGVLLCLRKVAPPPDGFLTFDRFVHGLRTSMLNSQNQENYQAGASRAPAKVPGKVGYSCKPQPLGVRYMNAAGPGERRCPPAGEWSPSGDRGEEKT